MLHSTGPLPQLSRPALPQLSVEVQDPALSVCVVENIGYGTSVTFSGESTMPHVCIGELRVGDRAFPLWGPGPAWGIANELAWDLECAGLSPVVMVNEDGSASVLFLQR
jgi:hypothetical protein